MIENITISPPNPPWCIPANSWPPLGCNHPLILLACSLSPIYNWLKRTQNLCHMTRTLAWSRLSQLTSSQCYPQTYAFFFIVASWFLRRAAARRWQAHEHCFPSRSQEAALPTRPSCSCTSSEKRCHQMAAVPHRVAQRPAFVGILKVHISLGRRC